ncbi:MAG: hypothetical protein IIU68_00110 [Bacteroidales bacterium]|nr:hypothetical protein [Bacteroidales bacterium]
MVYKYRITLSGIKGFFRLYLVSGEHTLYSFHKQIRSDLDFPADQPILFKAFDAQGEVVARYALVDLGKGAVDQVSIADTIRNGITSFIYFYDTVAKKSVIITLEGETTAKITSPTLVESKGPDPIEFENGYVAFEDLPINKKKLPDEMDDEEVSFDIAITESVTNEDGITETTYESLTESVTVYTSPDLVTEDEQPVLHVSAPSGYVQGGSYDQPLTFVLSGIPEGTEDYVYVVDDGDGFTQLIGSTYTASAIGTHRLAFGILDLRTSTLVGE